MENEKRSELVNPSAPAGKSLKYARREHERRFLLNEMPGGLTIVRTVHITDNYVDGTRLRVRQWVETLGDSTTTAYKLTQKVAAHDGGPGLLTTFYLTQAEHGVVAALPHRQLRKTRYGLPPLVIDVFDPPLDGLILAESEFDSEEALQAFTPPPFVLAEVTGDARFTGGRLATTTPAQLREALAAFGLPL